MAKIQNSGVTVGVRGAEMAESHPDRDAILSENQALRQLIVEIKLQCELLRERQPPKVSYH